MAIKFNLRSSIIPIEIGDFKFEVDLSDKNRNALADKFDSLSKQIENISKNDQTTEAEKEIEISGALKIAYDELLEEGAYDKLYGYTQSVYILSEFYEELALGVLGALMNQAPSAVVQQVMDKKAR